MPSINFDSIFGTSDSLAAAVSMESFLLCSLLSLVLGVACAGIYMFRNDYSKSFIVAQILGQPFLIPSETPAVWRASA